MLKHNKTILSHTMDGVSHLWFTPENQYYTRTLIHDMQPEMAKTFPLRVDFVNDEHCFEKYYRHREYSEVFAVELVLKGSMNLIQSNTRYHVPAGNVFLIHHDRETEYTTGPEGYCHRLACCISGHDLNSLLLTTRLIECNVIKLKNADIVESTMRKCFNEFEEKATGFRRRASILAYKLLLELEENVEEANTPDLLLRAVDLMEHHLSQKLSLKKMAEALNSAPTSLNRVFQAHFNTSPINYFIDLRIKAAKSLLINTKLQIQEVAYRTGYSDSLYFSAEFKKKVGVSPSKFRKKYNL